VIELARQLPAEEQRRLVAVLTAERFRSVLAESDRARAGLPELSDEEIEAELRAVREARRRDQARCDS